jgi:hypothetical protein
MELGGRGRVHDAPETDPCVGGSAHRAVLAGGVDARSDAPDRGQICCRPPGYGELGVLGEVTVPGPVAVLVEGSAVGADQDRAEGGVAVVERNAREFNTAAQMLEVGLAESHSAKVYDPVIDRRMCSADGSKCLGRGDRLRYARHNRGDLQGLENRLSFHT